MPRGSSFARCAGRTINIRSILECRRDHRRVPCSRRSRRLLPLGRCRPRRAAPRPRCRPRRAAPRPRAAPICLAWTCPASRASARRSRRSAWRRPSAFRHARSRSSVWAVAVATRSTGWCRRVRASSARRSSSTSRATPTSRCEPPAAPRARLIKLTLPHATHLICAGTVRLARRHHHHARQEHGARAGRGRRAVGRARVGDRRSGGD